MRQAHPSSISSKVSSNSSNNLNLNPNPKTNAKPTIKKLPSGPYPPPTKSNSTSEKANPLNAVASPTDFLTQTPTLTSAAKTLISSFANEYMHV